MVWLQIHKYFPIELSPNPLDFYDSLNFLQSGLGFMSFENLLFISLFFPF